MAVATETFSDWLAQAQVPAGRLTPEQRGLLQAAFRFRQAISSRWLSRISVSNRMTASSVSTGDLLHER